MSQQTVGFIDYVAQGGDTFDSIALVAYNEERMASTIIEANPDLSDVLIFEVGEAVRIPIVETVETPETLDRKSTRLNSSHTDSSRMPSSA